MIHPQLKEKLATLLKVLTKEDLLSFLIELEANLSGLLHRESVKKQSDLPSSLRQEVLSVIPNGRVETQDISVFTNELRRALEDLCYSPIGLSGYIQENPLGISFDEITYFENAFVSFLDTSDDAVLENAKHLRETSKMLVASLQSYKLLVTAVLESLDYRKPHDSSLKELSIFFEENYSLEDALTKLGAIQKLYSEMCHLMNVDEESFPLEIVTVETGSLLIELLGKSEVIGAISSLLKETFGYFYKTRTRQGKLEEIPEKVETIKVVASLIDILEAKNINIEPIKESIRKSALSVAEDLTQILSGERTIKLDRERLSETSETQKQIAGKNIPLLESSKDPAKELAKESIPTSTSNFTNSDPNQSEETPSENMLPTDVSSVESDPNPSSQEPVKKTVKELDSINSNSSESQEDLLRKILAIDDPSFREKLIDALEKKRKDSISTSVSKLANIRSTQKEKSSLKNLSLTNPDYFQGSSNPTNSLPFQGRFNPTNSLPFENRSIPINSNYYQGSTNPIDPFHYEGTSTASSQKPTEGLEQIFSTSNLTPSQINQVVQLIVSLNDGSSDDEHDLGTIQDAQSLSHHIPPTPNSKKNPEIENPTMSDVNYLINPDIQTQQ